MPVADQLDINMCKQIIRQYNQGKEKKKKDDKTNYAEIIEIKKVAHIQSNIGVEYHTIYNPGNNIANKQRYRKGYEGKS